MEWFPGQKKRSLVSSRVLWNISSTCPSQGESKRARLEPPMKTNSAVKRKAPAPPPAEPAPKRPEPKAKLRLRRKDRVSRVNDVTTEILSGALPVETNPFGDLFYADDVWDTSVLNVWRTNAVNVDIIHDPGAAETDAFMDANGNFF